MRDEHDYESMKGKILEEAKRVFKPEFLNRLDELIVFHTLVKTDLLSIVDLEVSKVVARIRNKDIHVTLNEAAREFLIEKGYDPTYGARPMRRCGGAIHGRPAGGRTAARQHQTRRQRPRDARRYEARVPHRRTGGRGQQQRTGHGGLSLPELRINIIGRPVNAGRRFCLECDGLTPLLQAGRKWRRRAAALRSVCARLLNYA